MSITTVSRALAGYGDVAEATRQRVLQAAQEMGYVPDVTARRLQKGRTDTIGFVIPTSGPRFSDPYFSELLAGIGNEAARHNFDLLVSTRSPDTPEEEAAYRRMVEGRLVDGLLVVRTRVKDRRHRLSWQRSAFPSSPLGDPTWRLTFRMWTRMDFGVLSWWPST